MFKNLTKDEWLEVFYKCSKVVNDRIGGDYSISYDEFQVASALRSEAIIKGEIDYKIVAKDDKKFFDLASQFAQ